MVRFRVFRTELAKSSEKVERFEVCALSKREIKLSEH